MKILVVIANYGIKNMDHLNRLIKEYKSMSFSVDIIVLSDQPKDLGEGIVVQVGLPEKNPWSLPFGHKGVFTVNREQYDLFIYSEDDVLITQKNIEAFLDVTKLLPFNEIAGFLRYEIDIYGNKYFSTVHSHFHWLPASVKIIEGNIFAHLSNDHSGCYIITREQLKHAINTENFMSGVHQGRYGLPETAATDIYTQCGFSKAICISRLDDFTLHHLPNAYIGKLGVSESEMLLQVEALKQILNKQKSSCQLFTTETKLTNNMWNKRFYEAPQNELIDLVPGRVKSILSIGCTSGTIESEFVKRNIRVTGIPIDAVIGSCAESKGVELVDPDFELAFQELSGKKFDYLLILNILQHLPDPVKILKQFSTLLSDKGIILISTPNMNHTSVWGKRLFGPKYFQDFKYIGNYQKSGLQFSSLQNVRKWLEQSGVRITRIRWGDIHFTATHKEKKWFLEGGLKPARRMIRTYDNIDSISHVFLNLFYGYLSSDFILLGQKKNA